MPTTGIRGTLAGYGVIGAIQGICLGGPTGPHGSAYGFHLQFPVSRNNSTGTPTAPSIQIYGPGVWRFRWTIRVGTQTIRCACMQVGNGTPRPTMVVKANPDVGLNADVTGTAPSSATWVTIGPLTVTASAVGAVFVEFHNNYLAAYDTAYFDLLVAT